MSAPLPWCVLQSNELVVGLLAWHKHLNYSKHDSDADSSCGHSTASSLLGAGRLHASSSTLSSMGSGDSLFSNSSMGSSIGSLSDSSGDSEAGEQCSECAQACEAGSDAGCDSDYHSCIGDDEDEQLCRHWSMQQHLSGDSGSTGSRSMCTAADVAKQARALETAFSAPAGLDFLGGSAYDPVSNAAAARDQGTGSISVTAVQGAGAGRSRPKSGVKAAAAIASAARRMAERFKPRRTPGLRRSHKSCSGAGL